MKDVQLRQYIIDELDFEPVVDAANIGVSVEGGIVTLSGHVSSYIEKVAAERAAQRVKGVRGLVDDIEVRFLDENQTADDQIAKRALDVLTWSTKIPNETIQVKVRKGWVTLSGTVDWQFQKANALKAVRKLSGVLGVTNLIEVVPKVEAVSIKSSIEKAFKRSAEVEANRIQIQVEGNKVVLEGRVHSWYERDAAERAAWSVPGVVAVKDNLIID